MTGVASDGTAAEWAARQVTRVKDDPAGRMALLARTYGGPLGRSPRHEPFRRAALSFMNWQAQRGVLRPLDASPPGSRWWRAVNERLLIDGCEAMARSGGRGGEPSSGTIRFWMSFIASPTAQTWYRAHNATIVTAYLETRELAETESAPERFFFNVALIRVLYAHALVAAPRLSLGPFSMLGRLLGDPRLGMAGAFLSLRRVLPDRYPLEGLAVGRYLQLENSLARVLDYGVIVPRVEAVYDWSAEELGIPALRELARNGSPVYAWSYSDRGVWAASRQRLPVRMLSRVTAAPSGRVDA